MPHRRPRKRGSFGGHFDEIVEQFPEQQTKVANRPRTRPAKDPPDIHDRLLGRSWGEKKPDSPKHR